MPWAHRPHKKEDKNKRDSDGDGTSGGRIQRRSFARPGIGNYLESSRRSIFSPGEDPKLAPWKSVDQVLVH
jgi:hypothetical protein